MSQPAPALPPLRLLQNASELAEIDLNYLLADLPAPCPIFLYQSNAFAEALRRGDTVSLQLIRKIRSELYSCGFTLKSELQAWTEWQRTRHPQIVPLATTPLDTKREPEGKHRATATAEALRHEFVAYAIAHIHFTGKSSEEQEKILGAERVLKTATAARMLSWFFEKRFEAPIYNHAARVTHLTQLFVLFSLPPLPPETLETLAMATLIHELDGDPAKTDGPSASIRSMEVIKQLRAIVPQPVLDLVQNFDETMAGTGPKKLKGAEIPALARIFAVVNAYDHVRLANPGGTRRARSDRARLLLEKRAKDFDPRILPLFWKFMASVEVID